MTKTRYGRVMLREGPGRGFGSYLVREEEDGSLAYYLGRDLARTADGWVTLGEEHRPKVVWDRERAAE
jgi:SLT domain-containing protein